MSRKLLFATCNLNKIKEISALCPASIQLISLAEANIHEELAETSPTIEGNSLQKAMQAFTLSGLACFAEDTGLEVEVLNNEPGVRSARYAGDSANSEANIDKLLGNLHEIKNRKARFKTVITYMDASETRQFEGILEGEISKERRGGNGFGYDSVFIAKGDTRCLAEMGFEEKNALSHRKKAFDKLVAFLTQIIDN